MNAPRFCTPWIRYGVWDLEYDDELWSLVSFSRHMSYDTGAPSRTYYAWKNGKWVDCTKVAEFIETLQERAEERAIEEYRAKAKPVVAQVRITLPPLEDVVLRNLRKSADHWRNYETLSSAVKATEGWPEGMYRIEPVQPQTDG